MYDAFISYSHAADGRLAPALQTALHRFAKPWYRLRALRIFRDKTSLAPTPGLWSSIVRALDESKYFVLLASPEAAASEWVRREVDHWLATKSSDSLIIALTDGVFVWDKVAGDIDPRQSTAMPPPLIGAFPERPYYVDFRWARDREELSVRNGPFREAVADLAAVIHERPRDEIAGEDVRQHRNTRRIASSAAAALVVLTAASVAGAWLAVQQRDRAEERGAIALSRQLAAQAVNLAGSDQGDLGLLLSIEANRVRPTVEARSSVLTGLNRDPSVVSYLHGHMRQVGSVAFSEDGTRLLSLGCEGIDTINLCQHFGIRVWDVAAGEQTDQLLLPDASRWSQVAYAADDTSILVSGSNEPVELWDLATGSEIGHFAGSRRPTTTRLTKHPAAPLLAATRLSGGTADIWDTTTQAGPLFRLRREGSQGGIRVLAFHPDGRLIATGGDDGSIQLWEWPGTGADARTAGPPIDGHEADVIDLTFSPDGRYLVSASWDDTVALWNPDNGERLQTLLSDVDVAGLAFSPDGDQLIIGISIGEAGGELVVMDTQTWRSTASLAGKWPVAFQPQGDLLASAGADGTIILRDLSRTQPLARELESNLELRTLAIDSAGTMLAGGSRDGNIRLWDLTTAAGKGAPLVGHTREVEALAFRPNDTILASGSADQRILLWDLNAALTGEPRELTGHTSTVSALQFSGDGALLASGSFDDTVRIWDVNQGDSSVPPFETGVDIYAVAFNPDGTQLAAATEDGSVLSWDLKADGYPMHFVGNHLLESDGMSGLAFVSSGNVLISSSLEETMHWDLLAETARAPLPGNYVAVNESGDLAAIGTDSADIVLVDVLSWQAFGEPLGKHDDYITAVAMSSDGSKLVTAGADDRLLLWDVSIDSWIRRACRIAGRNLSVEEWARFMGDLDYRVTCPDAHDPPEHPPDAEQALALGVRAAKVGDDAEAARLLDLAVALVPETASAELSNEICWSGAIYGFAQQVVAACNYAVDLERDNASYRDSRGLVSALRGDTEQAIEDFLFYIEQTDDDDSLAERRARRQQWVEQLEEGRDPFSDLTILQLRNEAWSF